MYRLPHWSRPAPAALCNQNQRYVEKMSEKRNKNNTAISKMLPFAAQNLGHFAGDGHGREMTNKEGQREGAENTKIWLNLPWSAIYIIIVVVSFVIFLKILMRVEKQRSFIGTSEIRIRLVGIGTNQQSSDAELISRAVNVRY